MGAAGSLLGVWAAVVESTKSMGFRFDDDDEDELDDEEVDERVCIPFARLLLATTDNDEDEA